MQFQMICVRHICDNIGVTAKKERHVHRMDCGANPGRRVLPSWDGLKASAVPFPILEQVFHQTTKAGLSVYVPNSFLYFLF